MAFGEEDTVRLCHQYRDAIQNGFGGPCCPLSERLHSLEQTIQFIAAVLAMRKRTDQETGRLVAIAKGQYGSSTPAPFDASR